MKRLVAIIDIDTTIANNDHRAELLQKHCVVCGGAKQSGHHDKSWCPTCVSSTKDKVSQDSWDTFLRPDLVALDEPVRKAQDIIHHWRKCGLEFHFLTGRNEGLREVTEDWLKRYFGFDPSREALIMRSNESHGETPASKYKEWAFLKLVKDRGLEDCIFLFCEDDPYVFRMYAKYGMCLRCPEGWEHFAPEHARGIETWQKR